jgi:hypothetical protein
MYIIIFLLFAACAHTGAESHVQIVLDITPEVIEVVEMDSKCELLPRLCIQECLEYGYKSSCTTQIEKMIVSYRN